MEIDRLMSEIEKSLKCQIKSERVSKLPKYMSELPREQIEETLTIAYKLTVQDRDVEFQDISGTEIEEKIRKTVDWMTGPPRRTCLMMQGTIGSAKTVLFSALSQLYRIGNYDLYCASAQKVYELFCQQHLLANSFFTELKNKKILFIDDLGEEPCRCQLYGIDYTPMQMVLSYRYEKRLLTVITTNLSDKMICERYGERITDRLAEMCTILRFSRESYRH